MIKVLPKVGIISCSGEDLCEGTISRLATQRVLGLLRPDRTVTICLPLFLAGDGQERNFATNFPTITVDGCAKRCAQRSTEALSGPVSAALVVTEVLPEGLALSGARSYERVSERDQEAIELVADRIAQEVDVITSKVGNVEEIAQEGNDGEATCSCVKTLPTGTIVIDGRPVTIAGLPLIFEREASGGLKPDEACGARLLEATRIYHPIDKDREAQYATVLAEAYGVTSRAGGDLMITKQCVILRPNHAD